MPSRLRARLRKAVFVLHLWIGLSVGLLFAVVSLSGSAIVFRRELDGVQRPYLAYVAPHGPLLSMPDLQARLRAEYPNSGPTDFTTILFSPSGQGALTTFVKGDSIAVDPYDGHTIAHLTGTQTFGGWAKDLHVELLQGKTGEAVNGYAALVAGVLLLSGLWLWWPATRRQIRLRLTVKRNAGFRRTVYDLHNVIGFYSLAILFVVTLTGAGLAFNKPLQKFVFARTGSAKRAPFRIQPTGERLSPDELMRRAAEAAPGTRPVLMTIPTAPRQPFTTMRQRSSGFFPYVNLMLDPYTGTIVRISDDATDPLGPKIMRQVSVLHFGIWGSTFSKVLYVLLGLVPAVLYATGILLWWKRIAAKRRPRASEKRTSGEASPTPLRP